MKSAVVVIPAYNESETIEEVIRKTILYCDVSVTDDASKDETPKILAKLKEEFKDRIHIIRHETNTHIPRGIQDGFRYAVERNYECVITMDAGLSHDPQVIPHFLEAGEFDLVVGSRKHKIGVPGYRRAISKIASIVLNYCLSQGIWDWKGLAIEDCTSGYRRYDKKFVKIIAEYPLESIAFDFHMEALSIVAKAGGSIKEIPIQYTFSNSSFNSKVLKLAIKFAKKLLFRKWKISPKYP